MLTRGQITLGILAGGQASRLGGLDKAFVLFDGEPLLLRTLAALGPGFAQVLVSYNGTDQRIAGLGVRAIADLRASTHGPLAGLESLLSAASSQWLLTVPVDLRDIPAGLPEIFCRALAQGEQGVVARDADGGQALVALWPVRESRTAATAALDAGNRAVHQLQQSMQFRVHDLSPWRLGNLNHPADFE